MGNGSLVSCACCGNLAIYFYTDDTSCPKKLWDFSLQHCTLYFFLAIFLSLCLSVYPSPSSSHASRVRQAKVTPAVAEIWQS